MKPKTARMIFFATMFAIGLVAFALILTSCRTEPSAPAQQQPMEGVEGIDWEDCYNNEPDCFLNRRRIVPTTAKKTTAPTYVSTTKKPTPVKTKGR